MSRQPSQLKTKFLSLDFRLVPHYVELNLTSNNAPINNSQRWDKAESAQQKNEFLILNTLSPEDVILITASSGIDAINPTCYSSIAKLGDMTLLLFYAYNHASDSNHEE